MNRKSNRKHFPESKRRGQVALSRQRPLHPRGNAAAHVSYNEDSEDELETPPDNDRMNSSGMYSATTFGDDENDEETTPFHFSCLQTYETPMPWDAADPFGDNLFADLAPEFTPNLAAGYEVSVMVRWGVPPRIHEFRSDIEALQPEDTVLVETEKGQFFGEVVSMARYVPRGRTEFPRKILRLATVQDRETFANHRKLAVEAFSFANTRIQQLHLDMKLFTVFVLASTDKMMFYFTSDARVDFRRLVRDLAARFSMRIEMRQMGPRDDSRITGGLGICGRELCCASYLNRFVPVSIRMAKDQNLVLNPQNISGQCNRLKCCLAYEQDFYQELRQGMPKIGKRIELPEGIARVQDVNLITGQIRFLLETGGVATYSREQYLEFQKTKNIKDDPESELSDENETGLKPEI